MEWIMLKNRVLVEEKKTCFFSMQCYKQNETIQKM